MTSGGGIGQPKHCHEEHTCNVLWWVDCLGSVICVMKSLLVTHGHIVSGDIRVVEQYCTKIVISLVGAGDHDAALHFSQCSTGSNPPLL